VTGTGAAPRFELLYRTDDLAGANDHFGCLLFHPGGTLAEHAGSRTWLYTGSLENERWVTYARELNVDTLECGPKRLALLAHDADDWATIHLVLQVRPDFFIAFYSTGRAMRAAVAAEPGGPFRAVPGFLVEARDAWETGATIESDGGFVRVSEAQGELTGWVLYDTLQPDTAGLNGWVLVRVDTGRGTVTELQRHPSNPLPLLLPGRLGARTGGNLASDLRIGGRRALFYLSKRNAQTYHLGLALADDPLFTKIDLNLEVDGVRGGEQVIEKFQAYSRGNSVTVIYEVGQPGEKKWRTGLRRYRVG
jgi:hypothetical protein